MPRSLLPRRPTLRLLLAALALAAALATGCAGEPEPRNVVWIVVDTLRADHVGAYGYGRETTPAVDALAAEGVLFEAAHATAPWTVPSVASMLSGLPPARHGVRRVRSVVPEGIAWLPALLAERGWGTAAVVSHHLVGSRLGFDRGFGAFDESHALGHDHVSTPGVTDAALEALEHLAGSEAPFFLFVHYFDPHYRWRHHPEVDFAPPSVGRFDGRESIDLLRDHLEDMTEAEVAFLRDLYDEEIRFTDAGIGRLLEALEERGLEGETVVVFTADHGEEFLERGWLGHTRTLYQELIRVPLVIRSPDLPAGERREAPVSLVDLGATVLELAGADRSALPGRSFAPLARGKEGASEARPVFAAVDFSAGREARKEVRKRALRVRRHKLIEDRRSGAVELYDLRRDAGEREDLAAERPELVRALRARLRRHRRGEGSSAAGERRLSPEERRRLEALGYLEPAPGGDAGE